MANLFQKIIDILLNHNLLRHLMNRSQSKNHRIRTYEINKFSLSSVDDKMHILNKEYDGSALGY